MVDLTEENGDFADPQSLQSTPEVIYTALNPDYVRQNVTPAAHSAPNIPMAQQHFPIHVSVTIPQCPYLQSWELSRNISPGPAQEILVPPPPPPPSLPPSTMPASPSLSAHTLPPTTVVAQCNSYTGPQHHTTLPPPPAHSNNIIYPHHIGNTLSPSVVVFMYLNYRLINWLVLIGHHYVPLVQNIVTAATVPTPPGPHPAQPPARPYPVHQRLWQSHQRVQELNRRRMDQHFYKYGNYLTMIESAVELIQL